MRPIGKTLLMIAGFFLLSAFSQAPASAEELTDSAIINLISDDFDSRSRCHRERGAKCDFGMGAPASHRNIVSDMQCPGNGGEPLTLDLPATGGYSDLGNTAYYCEATGAYWVLRTHGAFVGTGKSLFGPFPLAGLQATPAPQRGTPPEGVSGPVQLMRDNIKATPLKTRQPRIKTRPLIRNGTPSGAQTIKVKPIRKTRPGPEFGIPRPIANSTPHNLKPTMKKLGGTQKKRLKLIRRVRPAQQQPDLLPEDN
jgi:hypothetical protein